jgi:hypothetical protein
MSLLPDPGTAGLAGGHGGAYQGRPGRGWWPRTRLFISTAVFAVAALAGCSSGHATGKSAAPATASPLPSPSGTGTTRVCVTSAPKGGCGPSRYPGVTGTTSDPYVDQDEWGAVAGETQTLSANSPGDWKVVNSTPAGHGGSVTTFPDTGAAFNEAPLSGYSSVTSSFTETMPHNSATSAWAAYDLWFNNWTDEIMIQHDFTSQGPCTYAAVAQFGGSNGVPVQTWGLCTFGSERVWQLVAPGTKAGDSGATINESSGSVDIKAMVSYLENPAAPDAIPAKSTITNLSCGWEIASTGGKPETFQISRYTLTASRPAPH